MSLLLYLARRGAGRCRASSDCPPTCGPPPAACCLRAVGSPRTFPHASRFGPLGGLRGAHAQQDDGVEVQGAANQPRAILRASARAFPGGSKGGGRHPSPALCTHKG